MHNIHFTKMHGLGNDFVVINRLQQSFDLAALPIKQLADRHIGIGFDQLLLIETSQEADFFCRILNSDGTEAEQCGNGLRCVARFIHENKLHTETNFTIATISGVFPVEISDYDHINVTLGSPQIQEKLIELMIDDKALTLSILSTGNPHAILKVDNVAAIATDQLGPKIAAHPIFKQGANVGFMQILADNHLRLRTFERGAGETHACGSNACAAAVAAILNGWTKESVVVEFRYGSLLIQWNGPGTPIRMTGPATHVFTGLF